MINFYHRFMPKVAGKLAPLHAASAGKGQAITWSTECQTPFEAAKAAPADATLLHHPRANAPTSITVDASDSGHRQQTRAMPQANMETHRVLLSEALPSRVQIQCL